jgi:hypothetical protein
VAAAVYGASLVASLWFAWRGAWGQFLAAYGLAWAILVAGWLYLMGGSHGTHGSPAYMIAWGLAFLLPYLAFFALLAGFLAFLAGAVGAQRRAATDDEASR